MADTPRKGLSPIALAVIVAVFVIGVIVYILANPGGPGGGSGESRTEDTAGN